MEGERGGKAGSIGGRRREEGVGGRRKRRERWK